MVQSIDPLNRVDGVSNLVKRYSLNGVVDLGGSPASIVEEIQSACAGRLVFSQGKYRFYAGAFDQPVGTINGDMLRADPSKRSRPSRQDLFNIVRGKYVEPRQGWSETDYEPQTDAAAIAADSGSEIVQDLRLPYTTNGATAQRLARIALRKIRGATSLTLQCNWSVLRFRLWDVVNIDIPEINLIDKPFRIMQYTFAEGGGIDLVLQADTASYYAWNASTDEVIVKEVVRPAFNDGPPDPATNLVVRGAPRIEAYGTIAQLSATWDHVRGPFFRHYEVESRIHDDPDHDGQYLSGTIVTEPRFVRTDVAVGTSYDLRVRVVNIDYRYSEWTEVLDTPVEDDTEAPGIPTGLSVAGTGTHTITWTTPDNPDFKKSNVYANTVNDASGATLITGGSIVGLQLTTYSATNAPGGERYYFVSSVDRTGNESPLTFAGSGT